MPTAELAHRMRAAADTLAEVNGLYSFHPEYGVWNPLQLRQEAEVVESDSEVSL
jgi:hypothetical protein